MRLVRGWAENGRDFWLQYKYYSLENFLSSEYCYLFLDVQNVWPLIFGVARGGCSSCTYAYLAAIHGGDQFWCAVGYY